MDDTRTSHIETLKQRIDCAQYPVDAHRVAEAILRRPIATLWLVPPGTAAVAASEQRA
jgi:hypothetical protein